MMFRSIRRVVMELSEDGLINDWAAYASLSGPALNTPMDVFTELLLDAFVLCNKDVGKIMSYTGYAYEQGSQYVVNVDQFMFDAASKAVREFTLRGGALDNSTEAVVERIHCGVQRYVENCCTNRAQRLFHNDKKYRGKLVAALNRKGLSQEYYDAAVMHIKARHCDDFSEEYLDSVVACVGK